MVWVYVIAAVVIFLLLKELIRLPTVGKYGERYVFITGCDTGFGNMLAKRLDSLGFNVFAACFTERGADELRKVSSARLKTLSLDVTKFENIIKARETVERQLPPNTGLWAVVNNAGIVGNIAPSEMLTKADYEACLAVNLYGVIDVTRVFQPLVRKAKGRFVNITSMIGRLAILYVPYAVSKWGAEAFSDCLRRETLRQGITVHIIEPTFFKTEIVNFEQPFKVLERSYTEASREVKVYFGNDFCDKAITLMKSLLVKKVSDKPYLVVDAMTHAITARFPRSRYLVGGDKHFWRFLWSIPECFSDRLINRDMPVAAKAE